MDKIDEEFETQAINMGHSILKIDNQYIESLTVVLHTGFLMGQQSRDEEIKKLIEFEKIDKIRIEEGLAEIKKLRDEKTELKDAYAETFEKYIPVNKLSEVNEFLLSRFKDYGASRAMVDRREALKGIT